MENDKGNEAGDRDGAEGASGAERLTAPPDDARKPRLPFPVVGMGASAGGLEAYTEFLKACPADAGMAYILVQHLPPDRESMLAELLARHTRMPVLEVTDGQAVEPDCVYVIRPGHTLTIQDGRLRLGPELAARGHGRPVDDLFRSLAEEQQQRALAVVFSGMGSNGTAGAQAVKAVGGLVIAQEPESARYPAMPRGLIDAHLPDYILRPSEVPEALVRYAAQPYAAGEGLVPTLRDEQTLADVLAVLRTRTRHDFNGYRKPTLLRRVRRRMGLGQFSSMADYVRALRQTPAEVNALADDLLIHVTGFFRDPEAWEVLREKAIAPLAGSRPDGSEVRCWVSACATGEEAYSLAMLLVEAAEANGKRFDVKVFATDMAERALGAARSGVFPNGIESEVTPERLARFFDKDDSFYRVKKELREQVIFAPQNMLQDPPFSRLDVATCRNLLIYLEPETQRRVLALLHFGLREGGVLMLGTSESAALAEGDFEAIDKRHRIFRRVGPSRPGTLDLPTLVNASREIRPAQSPHPAGARPAPQAAQLVGRTLLDRYTPAAVAVDSAGQVVHVHGDTSRFLTLPAGAPSLDLMALANDQVRGPVRTALHRAAEKQAPVAVRDGLIDTPEGRRRVEVGAAPIGVRGGSPLYLVTFRDYPEPPPPPLAESDSSTAAQLADELQRMQNELQGALEEMQSSNEELKASHEEATSLNEELQSTNEELETSKEEMQSLNEELVTVNAQLQAKMGELEATANDLGSLLTSTDIAVLFLDPKFRIRRFTPAVKDLLDLIPSDVGRPFVDLRLKFADPDLLADAQQVLDKLVPVERSVESESGRHYLRRVLPYRTQDNRIDGVVVAFVDVTERRKADAALRANAAWLAGQKQAFQSALNGAPLEESLGGLVRTAVIALGEGVRAAFYLSDDGETLHHVVGMPPEYAEQVDGSRIGPESLARGLATSAGGLVITTDVMVDPRWEPWRQMAERFDYRGCWSFPILSTSGAFVGTFAVYSRRPREATARDLEFASLMTDAAAIIISRSMESEARRQAEAASRESEARLRLALAAARMGIWTLDADSGLQMRDANLNRLMGLEAAESTQPFEEFLTHIHPDDAGSVRAAFDLSMREGRPLDLEFRVVLPDRSIRWLRDQGDVFGDAAAGARLMAGACVDVTERREAEDALKAGEERLRLILESATDFAIFTMAPDRVVTSWSPGAQAVFGYTAEEMIGRSADEIFTPEDRAAGAAEAEAEGARRVGRAADERWHLRKDGARFYASGVMSPLRDGGDAGFVKVARDLTERKRMEDALRGAHDSLELKVEERTAELVATLGSLEAEMGRRRLLARRLFSAQEDERRRLSRELHDGLGQELTALILGLKALERSIPEGVPSREQLLEVERIVGLIGREAHDLAVELRPTALDDIGLDAAMTAYIARWSERSGVRIEFQPLGTEGGRLSPEVETACYRIVQEALNNVAKHAEARRVSVMMTRYQDELIILIEDDGRGFDPERVDADGGHLGLVGMRERVILAGGTFTIESVEGEGTVVRARIPLPSNSGEGGHGN